VADGVFDVQRVRKTFQDASASLPQEVAAYVSRALEQYPA